MHIHELSSFKLLCLQASSKITFLWAGVHSGVGGEEEGPLPLLQRGGQERPQPHAHEHIRRQ